MRYSGESLPGMAVAEATHIERKPGIPARMEAGTPLVVLNLARHLYGLWFEARFKIKISPKWGDLFFSLGGCFYV